MARTKLLMPPARLIALSRALFMVPHYPHTVDAVNPPWMADKMGKPYIPRMGRDSEGAIAVAVFRAVRASGVTDAAFARELGLEPRAVNNWKKRGKIPPEHKFAVARFLGLSTDALSPDAVKNPASFALAISSGAGNVLPGPTIKQVPLRDWPQLSGRGATMSAQTAERLIPTSAIAGRRAFALRVRDDLMEPEFTPGATIIVDPDAKPESGRYVIAQVDGQAVFRQLVIDGGAHYLKPLNPRYPISIMPKGTTILGVVVAQEKHY